MMNTWERRHYVCGRMWLIAVMATIAAALVLPTASLAQEWPTKPVNLVVGYGAGGGVDQMARFLARIAGDDPGCVERASRI
jgi:tripartite-type tricarboxylate transporter receptor subunit TctC